MEYSEIRTHIDESDYSYEEMNQMFLSLQKNLSPNNVSETLKLLIDLYDKTNERNMFTADFDIIKFCALIIKVYAYDHHHWRARSYANKCYELLVKNLSSSTNHEENGDLFVTIGDFYVSVTDARKALQCYKKAKNLYEKANLDIKKIVPIVQKAMICLQRLPQTERVFPSKEELFIEYGTLAKKILEIIDGKGYIVRDSVEQTAEFQNVYDEVQEETAQEMDSFDGVHSCYQRWQIMTKALKKRNIKWRHPGLMNPRVKFE